MRDSRGFTLIELLVVIAIIAILAAILFPVFTMARERARQSTCLSNVRQISYAWTMYCPDFGDSCPPLYNPDPYLSWAEILMAYVKNVKIYGCPSGWVPKTKADILAVRAGRMSYGWNCCVFNYPWSPAYFKVKLSDIQYPAKTVFACDSTGANWIGLPGGVYWNYVNQSNYGPGYAARPPVDRHMGLINCAFVDGHARVVPFKELVKSVPNTGRRVVD